MKRIGLCFCLSIIFAALLCGCGSEKKDLPSSTEQNKVFSSAGKQAEPESIVVLSISLDTFYSNKNYATRKI